MKTYEVHMTAKQVVHIAAKSAKAAKEEAETMSYDSCDFSWVTDEVREYKTGRLVRIIRPKR